ncbi:MAG TPA: class I SAM-dependent methyltransferase [Anaerolineales bacterium]|nr:class I SAM-dependent methyltransferase [Anaerolineales bacterium]
MSRFTDPSFLKADQYKDSSNLDARLELHRRFSTNPYGWFKWVFDALLLKLPANAKVLELGCGQGILWKENASRIPAGWDITLSDLSSGMLDAAWRNLVVTGRNYKFREIDAQNIPFEDETFDAVIANHMLYHVPDKTKALTEIRRILKPGGRLFAATVGEKHLKELNDWLKEIGKGNYVSLIVESFTLENGMEQLRLYFSHVTLLRYEDSLHVTASEPLIAYIYSMIPPADLQEDKLEALKQKWQTILDQKGEIFITKDIGLFEAIK